MIHNLVILLFGQSHFTLYLHLNRNSTIAVFLRIQFLKTSHVKTIYVTEMAKPSKKVLVLCVNG